MLKQVNGRWALVSKSTGRPLRYYKGEGKPSQAWVDAQEREIQMFKHATFEQFLGYEPEPEINGKEE